LPKGVPVFLVYFTAWVDKEGQLNFRKDIYGHDAKMEAKLFEK
jgi:murein L,D-transpeptidase YcbB/YkuD